MTPAPSEKRKVARGALLAGLRHQAKNGSLDYWDQFKHEIWRFQVAQQIIAKNVPSFVEFPPMQAGAGFSTADLKEKVEAAIAAAKGKGE